MPPSAKNYPIRARSHLLQLLGDELIGDDRLAVFELVKNSYDADASLVSIEVNVESGEPHSIVVEDTGQGMDLADITGKWLELATDSRRKDRTAITKRFHRRALGEKGVGRLASFKLGRYTELVTRSKNCPEFHVSVDWDGLLEEGGYLDTLKVRVVEREQPEVFEGSNTGTRITITGLRRKHWSRGDLRGLYRLVTSLASPFKTPDRFEVAFSAPGREADIQDLIRPNDFIQLAVWKFEFALAGRLFDWSYSFDPPHWKGVHQRHFRKRNDRLILVPPNEKEGGRRRTSAGDEPLLLSAEDLEGIGAVEGRVYVYYRRSEVLNATGNSSQIKGWLEDQTGVRVYRDGVRVFNYGERNDDWLGLNVRRINTPAGKLGTASVVSAVHVNLHESQGLREKTNREGFDHNETYAKFRRVILSVFEHLEREHAADRKALDDVLKGTVNEKPLRFSEAVANLRKGLKERKLDGVFEPDIATIEREFTELRDVMTNAGMAGLNLAVIFHEVEREVESLSRSVEQGLKAEVVQNQVEHLHAVLQGFAPLLKKTSSKPIFASGVVRGAVLPRELRFKHHRVALSAPLLKQKEADFKIRAAPNLVVGALGNLLDNALYWTRIRRERDEDALRSQVVVISDWHEDSGAGLIAVVDNGPGFSIPPHRATEAFFSTRPGGMGLGLYFAAQVMEQCGGELTIHSAKDFADEVDLQKGYDGAAVVLRFPGAK